VTQQALKTLESADDE